MGKADRDRRRVWLGILAATSLAAFFGLLAACGSDEPAPTATSQPGLTGATPPSASSEPAKEPWEIEWDETLAKAQAEGEVSLALGAGPTREFRPIFKAFQDEFGIRMIVSGGSGRQAAARILAERAAGQYTVDLAYTGATTAHGVLIPNQVLAPVEPLLFRADLLDRSVWYKNEFWWADPEHKYVFVFAASHSNPGIVINTDLVNEEEIKSYWDVLDPTYNGLHVSGDLGDAGGASTFHFLFGHPDVGPEFLTRYALETDLTMVSDARVAASWMFEGTKGIGMHLGPTFSTLIDDLESRGAPVKKLTVPMLEGSTLAISARQQIMVLNKSPNPNAQKLFLNWFLSPAGQLLVQHVGIDSLRIDIPKDMVDLNCLRREGFDYVSTATDSDYVASVPESRMFAQELAAKFRAQQ